MRQFRERLCGCRTCFWNLASCAAFISYNTCGGSEWLRNIKAPKTIHQQLTTMNRQLTTIVKPPSIMRVELMKRRGIMPTWPMATLAMHGIMWRKLVNIRLRNTARKNSRLRQLRARPWRPAGGVRRGDAARIWAACDARGSMASSLNQFYFEGRGACQKLLTHWISEA
jgi:hypothetical protein